MSFADDDRPDVEINTDNGDELVHFEYEQPNISVNTEGRYVTHDVIGDVTVRQKVGENPDEISMSGHCTGTEANSIDKLHAEDMVELVSNRWSGVCQVISTNTRPISDGGGMNSDAEWVHQFSIELVEVTYAYDPEGQALL